MTIIQDEDGMYVAECPSVPVCVSQGKSEEEAEVNAKEAIRQCLEVRAEKGLPLVPCAESWTPSPAPSP